MKNHQLLFVFLMSGIAFGAGTLPRELHRVKMTVAYLQGRADTSEYFYNPDGHISGIRSSVKGHDVTYEYLPGKVLSRYFDPIKGALIDTMWLNEKGMVIKISNNHPSAQSGILKYDANKYRIEYINYDSSGKIQNDMTYKYADGNEISLSNGNWFTLTNQYDPGHINTIGNENMGTDFLGLGSKNPVSHCSSQSAFGQQVTKENHIYHYHYDDKGRITIKAQYDFKTSKMIDSTYYSYYSDIKLVGK